MRRFIFTWKVLSLYL